MLSSCLPIVKIVLNDLKFFYGYNVRKKLKVLDFRRWEKTFFEELQVFIDEFKLGQVVENKWKSNFDHYKNIQGIPNVPEESSFFPNLKIRNEQQEVNF